MHLYINVLVQLTPCLLLTNILFVVNKLLWINMDYFGFLWKQVQQHQNNNNNNSPIILLLIKKADFFLAQIVDSSSLSVTVMSGDYREWSTTYISSQLGLFCVDTSVTHYEQLLKRRMWNTVRELEPKLLFTLSSIHAQNAFGGETKIRKTLSNQSNLCKRTDDRTGSLEFWFKWKHCKFCIPYWYAEETSMALQTWRK